MAQVQGAINTETGGDSFCYIDANPAMNDVVELNAIRVGRYPLRGVIVRIFDRAKNQAAVENLIKGTDPKIRGSDAFVQQIFKIQDESASRFVIPDFATPTRFLGGYQLTKNDKQSFDFVFNAFNGWWIERLEMREVNGKSVKALLVEATKPGQKDFFKIDPDYPRINGKYDVPWPRPVRGKPDWEH